MKSPFLLIFCYIFFFTNSMAQEYELFPESYARWSNRCNDFNQPGDDVNVSNGYYIEQKGDTILNGITYQKIYYKYTWEDFQYFNNDTNMWISTKTNSASVPILIGASRYNIDEKKVYYLSFDSFEDIYNSIGVVEDFIPLAEYVLYDFNLNVGDTIPSHFEDIIVTSIDSVIVADGTKRKQYQCAGSQYRAIVEGIGGLLGFFEAYSYVPFEGGCSLFCFRNEETYLYGGFNPFLCDSILSIDVSVLDEKYENISIFPNPFSNIITIDQFSYNPNLHSINLYNSTGIRIYPEIKTVNETVQLSIHDIYKGLYFINIYEGNELVISKKLIKE